MWFYEIFIVHITIVNMFFALIDIYLYNIHTDAINKNSINIFILKLLIVQQLINDYMGTMQKFSYMHIFNVKHIGIF